MSRDPACGQNTFASSFPLHHLSSYIIQYNAFSDLFFYEDFYEELRYVIRGPDMVIQRSVYNTPLRVIHRGSPCGDYADAVLNILLDQHR